MHRAVATVIDEPGLQLGAWSPGDFLLQFTLHRLCRGLPRFEMTAEQSPLAGGNDRADVVPQLQQPAVIAFQHGQGYGAAHAVVEASRIHTAKPPPRPRAHSQPCSEP